MNLIEEARRVFDSEIEALVQTRDSLGESFEKMVDAFAHCEGKIITMGLGKSGHIARKIASTLSSLGTPAFFLSPGDALNGDLGTVTAKDIVLIISNCGEAAEFKTVLSLLRGSGTTVAAITGVKDSALAREADIAAVLPKASEACRFGLAPTSSATAVLCFGDALAIALSELKGFEADDFRRTHPSGPLGKK